MGDKPLDYKAARNKWVAELSKDYKNSCGNDVKDWVCFECEENAARVGLALMGAWEQVCFANYPGGDLDVWCKRIAARHNLPEVPHA